MATKQGAAATKAPAKTAKKAPAKKTTPKKTAAGQASQLVVKEDEQPWTAQELDEVRTDLTAEVERLTAELNELEADLAGLVRDSGDGAGDDHADVGTKNFATEHEYTMAQNSREALFQSQRALDRIEAGTYGICESCGNAIGKLRLQAFPRATLCMPCKQNSERR